jgi:hypothetical protein
MLAFLLKRSRNLNFTVQGRVEAEAIDLDSEVETGFWFYCYVQDLEEQDHYPLSS